MANLFFVTVIVQTLLMVAIVNGENEPVIKKMAKIEDCLHDANALVQTCFTQYERLTQLLGEDKRNPNCCAYAELVHCIKDMAAKACDDNGLDLLHKHDLLHFAAERCEEVSITSPECLLLLNMATTIIIGTVVALTLICLLAVCCYKCIECGCGCGTASRSNGVYIAGRRGNDSTANLMMESGFTREPLERISYFPAPRYNL